MKPFKNPLHMGEKFDYGQRYIESCLAAEPPSGYVRFNKAMLSSQRSLASLFPISIRIKLY